MFGRAQLPGPRQGATECRGASSHSLPSKSRAVSHPWRIPIARRLTRSPALSRMVFKLVMAAAKTWRRRKGENQLRKVVQGVTFRNGVEVINTPAQNAA